MPNASPTSPSPKPDGERPFELFVSYSHANEAVKDRLLIHLAPLKRIGLVRTWTDRAIPVGSLWREEIGSALARADGAIFLLCADFLASDFCMDVELPRILQRHADEGVLILFVLAKRCNWQFIDFIGRFQMLPRDCKPIRAFRDPELAYTEVVRQIGETLIAHRSARGLPMRTAPAHGTQGRTQPTDRTAAQDQTRPTPSESERQKVLARLPGRTNRLYGRELELKRLAAWTGDPAGRRGVLIWVGPGGQGKSALTRWWLAGQTWPAGTRFVGHSFYSQGSRNQTTSARSFLLAALAELEGPDGIGGDGSGPDGAGPADPGAAPISDYDLGQRLARAAARAPDGAPRVLLLDGLEPLQQPSADPRLNGSVKDQGLLGLLETLVREPGNALCIGSSRLPIPDSDSGICDGPCFNQVQLHTLPALGARTLLRDRGLAGSDDELDRLAERCGWHPLALTLAAEFAHTFLDDSAAAFLGWDWESGPGETGAGSLTAKVSPGPGGSGLQPRRGAALTRDAESTCEAQSRLKTAPTGDGAAPERAGAGRHAATIMAWFDTELARGRQTLDRELVQILGLFDRPAPWGALLALKAAEPPIPGLTEALHGANDRAIAESLARLRQWGLVDCDPAEPAPDLDAHPLVRERFGARLETEQPDAWRAAHRCLFDWFCAVPEEERPDGLEGLEPLYRAVGHGCRAGLYDAARRVFYDRIRRGKQHYSVSQLGAISTDLAALAGFFPAGWSAPPATGDLSESARSWLITSVAYCLMYLGWLEESLRRRQVHRERSRESGDWNNFCLSSENLVDLQTLVGRWLEAERTAREAVDASERVADQSKAQFRKLLALAKLGRCLHGRGRFADSKAAFAEAESLRAQRRVTRPTLTGLAGFDYGQLLLEQSGTTNDRQAVCERARASLASFEQTGHLLFLALDHCQIGQSLAAPGDRDSETQVSSALDRAVATMRRANHMGAMPIVYLARAHHHRDQHRPDLAQTDLDAALAIARRGNMLTYLADCALLAGHLHLDRLARPTPAPATTAPIFEPAAAHPPTPARGPDPTPAAPPAADPIPDAARAWAQANEIIRRTGYGRRETELHLLEARLRHHQGRPDQASEALARAQSRIRAIGQWGLWPRLTQVAAELGVQVSERPPE